VIRKTILLYVSNVFNHTDYAIQINLEKE